MAARMRSCSYESHTVLSLKPCTLVGPMLAPPRPLQIPNGQETGARLPESLNLPADGSLILMTPTGGEMGARNGERFLPIKTWARATGGWKAFDSSTGFRLPDDSVLSPDASLVALDRWQAPAASPPCARRWPPTSATAPASAGC